MLDPTGASGVALSAMKGDKTGTAIAAVGMVIPGGKGAKSAAELEKHLSKLEAATEQVLGLEQKLSGLKGPKARKPIEEMIRSLKTDIRGHMKEIRQKWPEYPLE
jgi:hypothetical protein